MTSNDQGFSRRDLLGAGTVGALGFLFGHLTGRKFFSDNITQPLDFNRLINLISDHGYKLISQNNNSKEILIYFPDIHLKPINEQHISRIEKSRSDFPIDVVGLEGWPYLPGASLNSLIEESLRFSREEIHQHSVTVEDVLEKRPITGYLQQQKIPVIGAERWDLYKDTIRESYLTESCLELNKRIKEIIDAYEEKEKNFLGAPESEVVQDSKFLEIEGKVKKLASALSHRGIQYSRNNLYLGMRPDESFQEAYSRKMNSSLFSWLDEVKKIGDKVDEERSVAAVEIILKDLKNRGARVGVLVYGLGHQEQIFDAAKARGLSYIAPQI